MENKDIVNLLAPFVIKNFAPDENAKDVISTYEALENIENGETIDYAECSANDSRIIKTVKKL